jgi:heme/copper-type cytochrome/quinol oxidase subunit 2
LAGQDDVVQNKAESKAVGEVDLVLHGGRIMKLLIILVALVCIVALVITLALTKSEDTSYSSHKSISNQLLLYLALIPIIGVIIASLYWVLFA